VWGYVRNKRRFSVYIHGDHRKCVSMLFFYSVKDRGMVR